MRRKLLRVLKWMSSCSLVLIKCADAQGTEKWPSGLNTFSVGAEYSNNSNHVLLGRAYGRRLAGLDLTYSRRLLRLRALDWIYDAELRPLSFLQDPVSTTTQTVQFAGQAPYDPSVIQSGPIPSRCKSTVTVNPGGVTPGSTTTQIQTCGTRWTYAGGLSPLGQRVNFYPRSRLQPYLLENAGFMVSPRDVPSYNSSQFNFTFAFGGGIEFFPRNSHALSVDYQIHHFSNRALGASNPGIDSQLFRLLYTFTFVGRSR